MCPRLPGRISRAALAGFCLIFLGGSARAAGEAAATAPELVLSGKLFCSLKRAVPLPFPGLITELKVRAGQAVAEGEILARYRLTPEGVQQLIRRLSPPQIKDLEVKLAEVEKTLHELEGKQRTLKQLARQKLASDQSLAQAERELQLLGKQRAALQGRLTQEKRLAQEDLASLQKQLGRALSLGHPPREAALVAPISGHVVWVHPELRPGAELGPLPGAVQVGRLEPMLVRARVHEIEAQQLALGDRAEVSLEAIPGRKFEARLTRLSWAPLDMAPDQPTYYEAEFTLANPDLLLKEGLKARLLVPKPK